MILTHASLTPFAYSELTSPFVGQTAVNVLGVVTAIDGQIFNIQDLVGDGRDDTSDAIEVFLDFSQGDPNALLDRGDIVNIAVSTVVEFIPDGNARIALHLWRLDHARRDG